MDTLLKELGKLEKLTSGTSPKGKAPSIIESLDSLLESLREVKDRFQAGTATEDTLGVLSKTIEARKKEIDEKQKEIYNSLQRYGKSLDKVRLTNASMLHRLSIELRSEIRDSIAFL